MKNFDEKIREKLFDAEMPVSDGIWDSIEMNLQRKDKRPRIWFLLITLLIGVPILYYSYYYNTNQSSDEKALLAENQFESNEQDLKHVASDMYAREDLTTAECAQINSIQYPIVNSIFNTKSKRDLSFQIASGKKFNSDTDSELKTGVLNRSERNRSSLEYLNTLQTVDSESSDKIKLPRPFTSKSECPEFKAKWLGWYAYSQVNTAYPFAKLSSKGSEMTDLINQRNETESGLPSYSLEAGLGYDFVNGLFIQAGIQYNQINLKFSHTRKDLINTTTSIVIDTIFNHEGEVVVINRDTTYLFEYGEFLTKGTNTFKMFDIPVALGYRYAVNNRLRLTASAGVALNIRTSSMGKMVDNDGDPFNYGGDYDDMFKTKVGLSYTGSLGMETVLSERLYATAGLNFRYYPTRFNLESNPVDQSFLNLGISAGIKYRI